MYLKHRDLGYWAGKAFVPHPSLAKQYANMHAVGEELSKIRESYGDEVADATTYSEIRESRGDEVADTTDPESGE